MADLDYDLILMIMLLACGLLAVIVVLIYNKGKKPKDPKTEEKKDPPSGPPPEHPKGSGGPVKTPLKPGGEIEDYGRGKKGTGGSGKPDSPYTSTIPKKKDEPKKEAKKKDYQTKVLYIIEPSEHPIKICGKCGCENVLGRRNCSVCGKPL